MGKTLIGIPCMSMMHTRFVSSLIGMQLSGGAHIDFKIGSLVYDSRNRIVVDAIQDENDRILMIDSDMRFDPDLLLRLSARIDEGAEMVSALCFRRQEKMGPVIYDKLEPPIVGDDGVPSLQIHPYNDYPQNSFFQIAGCGFGCVMFTTELARKVWDKYGPPFTPLPWIGEDLSFCWRVKDMGIPIYCDSSIKVGHIGQIEYNEDMYLEYRRKAGGGSHQTMD